MHYRREIDGLRAVAVVPVVLFHAGFAPFAGGFVGVDVFFVISGYLITGLLIGEIDRGEFSLRRFYERRARRILPALFFVVLCCLPFAWMWMLPGQLRNFFQSVAATGLFSSNVLFWIESGYFASAAELKPLLHTWSLAVEEQYYIVFPLFLLAIWRFGRRHVVWTIAALTLASLALCEFLWRSAPEANFYLAPSRAWELLAGALCAFALEGRGPIRNGPLALAGLALVAGSVAVLDEHVPFPSLWALAPVGGTAMIILFAAPGTAVARLLSTRVLVGIGLVSYSAYLWHQPLFAFARIRNIVTPDPWLMAALAALSFVLAALSWRFVEQPFRGSTPLLPRRRNVLAVSAAGLAAMLTMGAVGHWQEGFPGRLGVISQISETHAPHPTWARGCSSERGEVEVEHPVQSCSDFMIDDRIDVAVMGDSHAGIFAYEAQQALFEASISSYAFVHDGCPSLPGFVQLPGNDTSCHRKTLSLLSYLREADAQIVILGGRFPFHLYGTRFDNGEGGVEYGDPGPVDVIGAQGAGSDADRRARVLEGYRREILALAEDFEVILVYPIPEAGWDVPQVMEQLAFFAADMTDLSTSVEVFEERNRAVIAAFDAIDHPRVHRVRPDAVFCDTFVAGRCANAVAGELFYSDDDHLSRAGATLLAGPILETVRGIIDRGPALR